MKYLKDYHDGEKGADVYFIKSKSQAITKTGKTYENVTLQDKTGTMSAKVWDPGSSSIEEFKESEFVRVSGEVVTFNGALQFNIRSARKARPDEYKEDDFMPASSYDPEKMYEEIMLILSEIKNPHLHALLASLFVEDDDFIAKFKQSSAAKSYHHGFIHGLLEHTLGVARLCLSFANLYPLINKDLLVSAALLHDIGKVDELSAFPKNEYTDDGNLLGHIVIGYEMISKKIDLIDGFPEILAKELKHCIISHHGELEYGSPKRPAIIEALALNFADNADAKFQTFREAVEGSYGDDAWLGYSKMLDSNIAKTRMK